jgi:hypothetical protein
MKHKIPHTKTNIQPTTQNKQKTKTITPQQNKQHHKPLTLKTKTVKKSIGTHKIM